MVSSSCDTRDKEIFDYILTDNTEDKLREVAQSILAYLERHELLQLIREWGTSNEYKELQVKTERKRE